MRLMMNRSSARQAELTTISQLFVRKDEAFLGRRKGVLYLCSNIYFTCFYFFEYSLNVFV